jgi:hypothetical protein
MLKFHENKNVVVAELIDEDFIIIEPQIILDLMGDCVSNNCNRIIINERNLHKDFFRLQTGLAGEILQKFSNYNFKLAIIGDFVRFKSQNLQDFIRESNKGNIVFFEESFVTGLNKLANK